jgi:hypothetical protein
MSRATRQQKSEAHIRTLEEQFSADLVAALRECAAGKWGLFGRNDHLAVQLPLLRSAYTLTAEALIEKGEEIGRLRRRLGMVEPFLLFTRYLEYRQMHSAHSPGEPKLAVQFLAELENSTIIGAE